MFTFEVRNSRTKTSLGIVTVEDPEQVLEALAKSTGCEVDDIVFSLGKTAAIAKASLELIDVSQQSTTTKRASRPLDLPRRGLYG